MPFFKNFMRISNWWHYKAAPLMAFIYAKAYINVIAPLELASVALVFFVAVVGIASLGHFINDIADIKEDERSGKENFVSKLNKNQIILSIVLLLLLSVLPWFYLKIDAFIIGLLILQLVLFLVYSFKPFRLKKRHLWGVVADTLYGQIIPALVVLAVFSYYGHSLVLFHPINPFSFVLIFWLFCKGGRNIILHQLDDRKTDKYVGTNTFVVKFGCVFSLNLINRIILPLEFVSFAFLLYFASNVFAYFYLFFAAFLVFTFFKFSLWKVFVLPPRQMRFKFLFFLNDFYEDWLTVVMLAYLISLNSFFVFYLIIHLLLFPKTVVNFVKDINHFITRK